jgi:arylsulfatase A-like enzyme
MAILPTAISKPGLVRPLVLGLSFALALAGCNTKPRPRNFILITLDTMRADHMSAIAAGRANTPNLDALAGRGTLFKNCNALIPITLPSHASLFFSEPPTLLTNYNNGQVVRTKRALPSLATLFKKSGFSTAAFVSLGVLHSQFGLNQGFDTYVDDFPPGRWYLHAGEVNERVFPWLEAHKNDRFFLWIHYSDPHEPYATPDTPDDLDISLNGKPVGRYCLSKYMLENVDLDLRSGLNRLRFDLRIEYDPNYFPFPARFDLFEISAQDEKGLNLDHFSGWYIRRSDNNFFFKDGAEILIANGGLPRKATMTFRGKLNPPIEITRLRYRKEVEYMDREIGRLWAKLEELGLDRDSAILAVGDHGEGLGEYLTESGDPHIGHIHYLQDIYMRVPQFFLDPGSKQPSVRDERVTLLDVAPTIASIMGLRNLPHFQGRNLLRLKRGASMDIFEETYRPEAEKDRFAILGYPWHLIFTPETRRYEIYNLAQDPGELKNLFVETPLPDEVASLKRKLDDGARRALLTKEAVDIDKKGGEILRGLGYIK